MKCSTQPNLFRHFGVEMTSRERLSISCRHELDGFQFLWGTGNMAGYGLVNLFCLF